MDKKSSKRKIAIIGYGRFGQLLARIMAHEGQIFVLEKKKIQTGKVKQIAKQGLGEMDWIFFAVPISSLEGIIKDVAKFVTPGTVVMDVSSVKVWPCRWMKKHLPKGVEIIGAHPLFGPDSAKDGLEGLSLIICPVRQQEKNLRVVKKVFKEMKLNAVIKTPAEHDKIMAKDLALVHYIGRALDKVGIEPNDISSRGYRRLQKVNETVTNDTWQLFFDMQRFNPYAVKVREQFKGALNKLDKKIGD